jgi:hypothetical protein
MKSAWIAAALLLAAGLAAAQTSAPPVTRAALSAIERQFDLILSRPAQEDPFDLLGSTRGVYLEGYGAVFTTELSLVVAPGLSPFRPAITKADAEKVRARKLKKLPELKQAMQQILAEAASKLEGLAPDEQIAVAVTLCILFLGGPLGASRSDPHAGQAQGSARESPWTGAGGGDPATGVLETTCASAKCSSNAG